VGQRQKQDARPDHDRAEHNGEHNGPARFVRFVGSFKSANPVAVAPSITLASVQRPSFCSSWSVDIMMLKYFGLGMNVAIHLTGPL